LLVISIICTEKVRFQKKYIVKIICTIVNSNIQVLLLCCHIAINAQVSDTTGDDIK